MRISDWSSDLCSSDLKWAVSKTTDAYTIGNGPDRRTSFVPDGRQDNEAWGTSVRIKYDAGIGDITSITAVRGSQSNIDVALAGIRVDKTRPDISAPFNLTHNIISSAEHTFELQYPMRIWYAVHSSKKKKLH